MATSASPAATAAVLAQTMGLPVYLVGVVSREPKARTNDVGEPETAIAVTPDGSDHHEWVRAEADLAVWAAGRLTIGSQVIVMGDLWVRAVAGADGSERRDYHTRAIRIAVDEFTEQQG